MEAKCDYQARNDKELSMRKKDVFAIMDESEKELLLVLNSKGHIGYVPSKYVHISKPSITEW